MRAAQITSYDGPAAVEVNDVPDAHAGPGHLLVEVKAAGVAFPDVLHTRGQYQLKPQLPFTPGMEVAGVVRDAPDGSSLHPGDRVMGFSIIGGMAELMAVPLSSAFPLPESMSFAQGASFPLNYHTAHFCLVHRGRMEAGDVVLVHGAAGGVGTASIQVAKGLGAQVLAVVSTDEKARVAADAGADEVLRSDGPWKDEARELTDGKGVDLVLDPVGGDRFTDSLRSLAREGRLLVVGFAAGSIPEVKVNRLLLSNTSIIGCAWGEYIFSNPEVVAETAAALDPLIATGALDPPVGAEVPLEEAARAIALLDDRQATGKVVLTVG